jgi:DNA polymerase III delta subunit
MILSAPKATLGTMKPLVVIAGPRAVGPGERDLMMEQAHRALDQLGVDSPTRIDVPPKGTTFDDSSDGAMRPAVQEIVPALQSGSLFGGADGVLVVDADELLKAEAEVIAELLELSTAGESIAVFVAAGAIPAPLGKLLRNKAETLKVNRITERSAGEWLGKAARDRGIRLDRDASTILLNRFGTNVAALGQALDQLAVETNQVDVEMVRNRFKNRPDEPMWHYVDAIVAGDQGTALRRLADFHQHGHPLQLLAFLQNDVRRRSVAAAAPDYETFVDWDGGKAGWAMEKVWKQRGRIRGSDLKLAVGALARADLQLKTSPETTHRVTMERLTVAMCRWYGGARRR